MPSDIDGILSGPIVYGKTVTIDSFPEASQPLLLQRDNSFGKAAALCQLGCQAKGE
jgi:hypothetical protein